MNSFNAGWYLLYTRPRFERKVSLLLTEKKINNYLPMQRALRTWRDRKKIVSLPMFPSYVFINLESPKEYVAGLEPNGVLGYVKCGKEIARVDHKVVQNLQIITDSWVGMEIIGECLQKGEHFLIKEGALAGLNCEVLEYKGKEKILVRVNLLNRNVLLNVPASYLIKQEAVSA